MEDQIEVKIGDAQTIMSGMNDESDLNKKISDSPQFKSTLLPIGDGLTVAVKI